MPWTQKEGAPQCDVYREKSPTLRTRKTRCNNWSLSNYCIPVSSKADKENLAPALLKPEPSSRLADLTLEFLIQPVEVRDQ